MPLSTITNKFVRVVGSRNDRLVTGYRKRVRQINEFEPQMRKLTDAQLRAKTAELREAIGKGGRAGGRLPEALAVAREVMDRAVGIRNIFNPAVAAQFDKSKLPLNLHKVYADLYDKAQALEPVEEIGCSEPVPGYQQIEIPNEM